MTCAFGEGLPGFVRPAVSVSGLQMSQKATVVCAEISSLKKGCTQRLVAQFGATMNGKIRVKVSETIYKLLEHKYLFQERGIIEVKGKGKMKTYLVIGKK
jgi:hypothetical protein